MHVTFQGPAGALEGLLWEPKDQAPTAAVVVCHPHPKPPPPTLGGTMRNNVVHRAAGGFQDANLAVLRFNFRSVGLSEGVHDGEGAEDGDLVAALDFMADRYPDLELWGAGFSFGSRTVASVARTESRMKRICLIAFPVAIYDLEFAKDIQQPGMALMAELDGFGTLARFESELPELAERLDMQEVEGADHFFKGQLNIVRERIAEWARKSLQEG
ncbi:MAG: alpha/beta hydrolase [Planctomycetota bacterium]|nr:alpha/beta hydrolase [Planctomycetota bacterium]